MDKDNYLSAKTTEDLKSVLSSNGETIDSLLSTGEQILSSEQKNQLALIYYNEQKLPFLLSHKIKYLPDSGDSIDMYDGIMIGIVAIGKDVDLDRRYILDEKSGEIYHIPSKRLIYPTKRISCHPEIS